MSDRYVLASPHARYEEMRSRLTAKYLEAFSFVSSPQELTVAHLTNIAPRYVFLPHWSHIVPKAIHSRFECVIFHMTDVPFGRGGSPLQNLIVRGIYETQLTALRCVSELDAGPVYLKRPLSLHGTAEEILLRASDVITDMIYEIIEREIEPVAQAGPVTVFPRRTPEQSAVGDAVTLRELFDRIRMLDAEGYPKAFLRAGKFKFDLSRASLRPGEIIADVRIVEADDDE